MTPISFTANHLKNVEISRYDKQKYTLCSVALIELDPKNKNDVKAVKEVTNSWTNSLTIYTESDMQQAAKYDSHLSRLHIYALTTQKFNHKKIKPNKILGITDVWEKYRDGNRIEVLQTAPDYIKTNLTNPTPEYKHIGSTLIKYVQDKYDTEPLYVQPTLTAIKFYKKQGFQKAPGYECYELMRYMPDKAQKEFYA